MLPNRRLELYLAQAALMVVCAAGARDVQLTDFLFDPFDDEGDEPASPDEAKAFFNFNPRQTE